MGISKSGRNHTRAPNRAVVRNFAAALIAGALTALSSSAAIGAPTDILSPFPELLVQDAQDRPPSAPATQPAASEPAAATLPAADAATMPAQPSTAPFLPAPPAREENEPRDIVRTGEGEIVPAEVPAGPLRFSFTGLYMYGPVKGIAQTPFGGRLHSTSVNRPSFNAIGVDSDHIGDGEFAVGISPHQQFFIGGQYIHMSGNGVLRSALISDNVNFPARTRVHSNIRMDWYRLGYRYTFDLDTAANGVPDLTLTPFIDAIYWDYGFSMEAGRIGSATRSFTKFGIQAGITAAWRPNGGPLSIEFSAAGFPQITKLANVSVETILARYHFYHFHNFDFNVLLGVAFEQQSFKDAARPIPNHVTAEFGPMLVTGMQVNF